MTETEKVNNTLELAFVSDSFRLWALRSTKPNAYALIEAALKSGRIVNGIKPKVS